MIDFRLVVENLHVMRKNIKDRNLNIDLDGIVIKYQKLISLRKEVESLQHESNLVANLVKKGRGDNKILFEEGSKLKSKVTEAKEGLAKLEREFHTLSMTLPNWMSSDTPIGKDENSNVIIEQYLNPTVFDFDHKDHIRIGQALDLIDFEAGAKVAGSKFYFLKNEAVMLQHAIKNLVFRKAIKAGFIPIHTPDVANNSVIQGVGFNPRGTSSNIYGLRDLDLSLIATAEICACGMHSNDVLDHRDLPILYVAESHCFRREAGSAGRESKGLYRVHQFEKIELFAISDPDRSEETLNKILELEKSIYRDLEIPYRVVLNASGDLGNPAYKKYDIEAWMPGKGGLGEYGEITSASNCTDFQSRRLNIKFKKEGVKKNQYVHTLNGTATALSRTIIAILENYQVSDGSVRVPVALREYLGFEFIRRDKGKGVDTSQERRYDH